MQLLALFPQRAAAARARTSLIESGVHPDSILTVNSIDDFLIDDEVSNSHMSFWAHVNALLQSEKEMRTLERRVERGACLMSIRAPREQMNHVTDVLKGARAGATCYLDRRGDSGRRAKSQRGASSVQ